MKLVFFSVVASAFISLACSLMCYQCLPNGDGDYTVEQCEKDQKKVICTGEDDTCIKRYQTMTDGTVNEARDCIDKTICKQIKKTCGDDELKKKSEIKECEVACCVSDGDKPCNSGFTVFTNMLMMMFAVLCSLKMF